MEYVCTTCNTKFKSRHNNGAAHRFCSVSCHKVWMQRNRIEINCIQCGAVTTNPKFCSSSCAASYNNVKFPKKKKKERCCKKCSKKVTHRAKLCKEHNSQIVDWSKVTYGEAKGIRKYQKNSRIRGLARRLYLKSSMPHKCYVCGYSKYFDVCHKKPVYTFDDSVTIAEINSLSNLVALCKNHHWEFDKGDIIL